MVVLYRIPEDDETPFVNMYLPKSVDWVSQANWLFGDLGDFYVAVRSLAAYTWDDRFKSGAGSRSRRGR